MKPWEKYGAPAGSAAPWTKYAAPQQQTAAPAESKVPPLPPPGAPEQEIQKWYNDAQAAGMSWRDAWMAQYAHPRMAAEEAAKAAAAKAAQPDPNKFVGARLPYQRGSFSAATEGSQAGLLGGFDDELKAAMMAPIDAGAAAIRGQGFHPVDAYSARQRSLDQQKAARRAEHPIASLGGEVAGGLALGGVARRGGQGIGPSALNRSAPYIGNSGAAALEGAAYGGVYGAGEAKPGERLAGAGKGAATGAVVGAALNTLGSALANSAGRRAVAMAAPAATEDQLAAQSKALYDAADQAQAMIKPQSFDRVAQNAKAAAGGINTTLRPNTAGILDDITALQGQPISLRRFDELRQEVGMAMERAQPQDVRTLTRIKTVIDNFSDNARPVDITGDVRGFQYLKDARPLWAKHAKVVQVRKLLELAQADAAGRYTQSGLANAIRQRANSLYKEIIKHGPGSYTGDEVELIKKMASGGSSSQMINWLAKWAPRGVVSGGMGALVGSTFGGPIGTALGVGVPVAGAIAGRVADKGALAAMTNLRDAAARGYVQQAPRLANPLRPFIPAGVAGATEAGRILFPKE